MPLVAPAGNGIEIDFTAKADDLLAEVKRINSSLDQFHAKNEETRKSIKGLEDSTTKAKLSITDFRSAYQIATDVVRVAGQIWDATAGKTLAYADQVRLLGQINGQTAESNSRLIQTLDDYKISVDDITVASKKMKDNGLTPSIDSVAKLAEKYQAIKDPAEKLKFAQDNLGKSTKDWLEVLNQSPEVLRKQAAGISENLILTQKMLDDARLQQIAQDSLNDSVNGLSITLGAKLIPMEKRVVDGFNVWIRAIEIARKEHIGMAEATDKAGYEIYQEQQAMLKMRDSADQSSASVDGLSESQKKAEDTAKALSSVFTGLLSSMSSIQSAQDSYQKSSDDIAKSDKDLADKKQQLTYEWYKQVQAGKDTVDGYNKYMEALADISKSEQENADKKSQLDEDVKKATQQRKYDLVEQKLAVDGVSTKEFDYLENLKVNYGLVSRAAADQAIAENQAADALVAGFEQTLPPMERSLQIMQQIAAFNGTRVNFGVNFSSNAANVANYIGYGGGSATGYGNAAGNKNTNKRDSGGPGIAGTPYMIGTGAQPEVFIPNTNGTFVPNADKKGFGGTTYNIVINNPVPEKSENSIRSAMKRLAVIGVAA